MPIEIFVGGLVILTLAAVIIAILTHDPRKHERPPKRSRPGDRSR